ncbi:MAG: hypothetical protein IJW89_02530 [Clostridia bacterium]|nr:hypothetical protein [Clostridia bacterium]
MSEPIYYSKIEFIETIGYGNPESVILLNLPNQELSYQVLKWKYQSPAIQGIETEEWNGNLHSYDTRYPAKWISSQKTNFKPILYKDEHYEQEVVFSYGIKLTEQQMEELLPLCNALDFEPFRDREMIMGEEGYCGYRDEVRVKFRGITDSHIPLLELPMYYYYDSEHIWPSEKLYRHIIKNIFDKQKKMKGWYTTYSGFSLPI